MHYEIERKYLIEMPDANFMIRQPDCRVWEIEQIYLKSEPGETRRVRKVTENGRETYFRTFKKRITFVTAEENEAEISREAYENYLKERDTDLQTIEKRRYRIPYCGHLLEIDVYPFWQKQAVLEIELESEAESALIPEWLKIKREVTSDKRYKNVALARNIPLEDA